MAGVLFRRALLDVFQLEIDAQTTLAVAGHERIEVGYAVSLVGGAGNVYPRRTELEGNTRGLLEKRARTTSKLCDIAESSPAPPLYYLRLMHAMTHRRG